MSNTNKEPIQNEKFSFRQVETLSCSEVLNCPYKRLKCKKFDFVLKRCNCQTHANKYSKSIRCECLPSCVPNKYHFLVLQEGRLHV